MLVMPHTILLVDDNDLYRGMLRSLLELHGYQIIPARSGAEGLAWAASERIDAAVVDVGMPEMDGFEFCRRLRAQQQAAGQDIPVWIITGTLRPGVAKHAAAAGALLALRKPFPIEELRAHLEQRFQQRDSPPGAGGSSEAEAGGG
jgi:CheY-like chemotaxis protein